VFLVCSLRRGAWQLSPGGCQAESSALAIKISNVAMSSRMVDSVGVDAP
jgi:hypothetical protein